MLESIISHMPALRIEPHLLPEEVRQAQLHALLIRGAGFQRTIAAWEQRLIEARGIQVRAAEMLGLHVQTLNAKLHRNGRLLSLAKRLREAR